MLFDTHAHLNFAAFNKDRDEVVKRSLEGGVWFINVGSDYETSEKAVEIAEKYDKGVYAAIGLHPINLDTGLIKLKKDPLEGSRFEKDFDYPKYKDLAGSLKVVAIGEIGLDYWTKPKTKGKFALFCQKQREVFLKQMGLAKELGLPVIFHCRKAHDDLIGLLKYALQPRSEGVVHCFSGSWTQAKQYLDMGLHLGFNGIIFNLDLDEVIKKTPLKRILIETDCPYLTPLEKQGRNEPLYVKYIAQRIAQLRGETLEEIAEITFQNGRNMFRLR